MGVFLAYATTQGTAFIDRALFLPKAWAAQHGRRMEAGVPDEVRFATKPQLARAMVEQAFAAGLVAGWVTADTLYGCDRRLRQCLEQRYQRYVLAIKSNELLPRDAFWCLNAKYVAEDFATEDWQRLSAGAGTKGPRWFDWAWRELPYATGGQDAQGWGQWLLVRRNITDPTDLAYYLVFAPRAMTTLAQVVAVAGMRWQIEVSFEVAKGECGLGDYEVRSWDAWHRHITLVLLAHAFLVVMRAQLLQKGDHQQTRAFRLRCLRCADSSGTCSGRIRSPTPRFWHGPGGVGGTSGARSSGITAIRMHHHERRCGCSVSTHLCSTSIFACCSSLGLP